jgi:hypothetical protein
MSGGVGRVQLDKAEDYQQLRNRFFGCDLIPLPQSLGLSPADAELNRRVKIAL